MIYICHLWRIVYHNTTVSYLLSMSCLLTVKFSVELLAVILALAQFYTQRADQIHLSV